MSVKHEIRKLCWNFGLDVSGFKPDSNPIARKRYIFKKYEVDLVLDVGANTGQFAKLLRSEVNYKKRIVSFEPLSSAYQRLEENSKEDSRWDVLNYALGDLEKKTWINIANNSYSSSILNMLPTHLNAAPESKYIDKEETEVHKLDTVFNQIRQGSNNIFLKIDTQGFESKVIKGAEKSLLFIDTILMEMSLVPLYKNEILFPEMCSLMTKKGYGLIHIEPEFKDEKSGQLLQVNGIFHRL